MSDVLAEVITNHLSGYLATAPLEMTDHIVTVLTARDSLEASFRELGFEGDIDWRLVSATLHNMGRILAGKYVRAAQMATTPLEQSFAFGTAVTLAITADRLALTILQEPVETPDNLEGLV